MIVGEEVPFSSEDEEEDLVSTMRPQARKKELLPTTNAHVMLTMIQN